MAKIICAGACVLDLVAPLDTFPEEDRKYHIQGFVESGGGPAANAAYLLGKYGEDVEYIGVLGRDQYADFLLKEFETVNVKTGHVVYPENYRTSKAVIMVNRSNASRTIISARQDVDDCRHLLKEDIQKPEIMLFDGHHTDIAEELMRRFPAAVTVIDAGNVKEKTAALAKKVDYLVCSEDFAADFLKMKKPLDIKNKETIISALAETFRNHIVVTLGARGCLYQEDNTVYNLPAYPFRSIDTTGAGDIFHGAFVYGLAHKMPVRQILVFASLCAGMSTEKAGGRTSIPDLESLQKRFAVHGGA